MNFDPSSNNLDSSEAKDIIKVIVAVALPYITINRVLGILSILYLLMKMYFLYHNNKKSKKNETNLDED